MKKKQLGVTGDTLISTNKGLVPIDMLITYDPNKNITKIKKDIQIVNHKGELETPTYFFCYKINNPVTMTKLSTGMFIHTHSEQKILGLDSFGFKHKAISISSTDKLLCVSRRYYHKEAISDLNSFFEYLESKYRVLIHVDHVNIRTTQRRLSVTLKMKNTPKATVHSIALNITEDMVKLLAYYFDIGVARCSSHKIEFKALYKNTADDIKTLLKNVFGLKANVKYNSTKQLIVSVPDNRFVYAFFTYNINIHTESFNNRTRHQFPSIILQGTKVNKLAFLNTLFTHCASIVTGKVDIDKITERDQNVYYITSIREAAQEIQALCLSLGIASHVSNVLPNDKWYNKHVSKYIIDIRSSYTSLNNTCRDSRINEDMGLMCNSQQGYKLEGQHTLLSIFLNASYPEVLSLFMDNLEKLRSRNYLYAKGSSKTCPLDNILYGMVCPSGTYVGNGFILVTEKSVHAKAGHN